MLTPMQMIIAALGVLLALSTAGNAWLGRLWLNAREEVATQTEQRRQATDAAMQCSTSIADLEDRARQAAAAALPALADARAKALTLQQRAQATLAAPASTPGDDCKSARDRADEWLANRSKP